MRKENNDCIRYLMKEMDPSEELLMERAMMEDEDLLIEVESMRQTLNKLEKLPKIKPPSHVTQSVLKKASEHAAQKRENNVAVMPVFKYAVAATLALTITAGGTWLYVGGGSGENRAASASSIHEQLTPESAAATLQFSSSTTSGDQPAADQTNVEPWVDRNDILKFEDEFLNGTSDFEALLKKSSQKLRLIDNSTFNHNRVKSIQLTGSGN